MTLSRAEQRRVELTTAVRDTDAIPKVDGAGEVRDGVQLMHNGVVVEAGAYCGDWMIEIIRRLRGHHEPQEEVAFHAVVERLRGTQPVMIEFGCWWAYYSAWLAKTVPGARCLMVEPDAENLADGRRTFELNGLDGTFVQGGVPGVSVDGLMADHGLDRVDVLHLDVQGAELEALAGAAGALQRGAIRFVVLSTHHESISGDPQTHARCLEALGDAHIICTHEVSESCSGDGLIVASFDPADRDLRVAVTHVKPSQTIFAKPSLGFRIRSRLPGYRT